MHRLSPVALGTVLACATTVACAPASHRADYPSRQVASDLGSRELWITAQDRGELKILGAGGEIETILLGPDAGPHEITFSPTGRYAYVANMGNGELVVIRADDRAVVARLALGPSHTHQAIASPDGSVVLAAQMHRQALVRIAADEATESWSTTGELTLPRAPVCAAFRADGQRAYVSLAGSGIAIVDVPGMALLDTLATAGAVQCGLVAARGSPLIFVASNGENMATGHFYSLDTRTDRLTLHSAFPARDLHGFSLSADGAWAYAAEREADQLRRIDLSVAGAAPQSISLDFDPSAADRPDKVAVTGADVYVTLRGTGAVARLAADGTVDYIRLVPGSNYALHGIALRP